MPMAAALRAADLAPQKAAIAASLPYVIHSDGECERLELQARLANIEGHLRHLPIAPGDCILDIGCGSGSMARLIGHSFPRGGKCKRLCNRALSASQLRLRSFTKT